MVEVTRARAAWTIAALAAAWLIVAIFRSSVSDAASLHALAGTAHPYWQPGHVWLLYLAFPVVCVAAMLVVLTPGLLLALSFASPKNAGEWIIQAFAISMVLLPAGHGVLMGTTNEPGTFGSFFLMTAAVSLLAAGALMFQLQRKVRLRWPLGAVGSRAMTASMLIAPAAILAILAPKFLWENFNGDGAHAFEAARLLLQRAFPFWDSGAGEVSNWPGISSMLFAYPISWFIQLFGPLEIAARLPFVLYLIVIFAGVYALCFREDRTLHASDLSLIWLALAVYTVVVGFSVTYSPYSADLALPGAQDTQLVALFLGFVWAFAHGRVRWVAIFGVLSYLTLPSSLMLLGFWWLAALAVWRPLPLRMLIVTAGLAVFCVLLGAIAPALLKAIGQPVPGGELAAGNLLQRFNWLQVTDWRRFLYVIVPCGILPASALLYWKKQDTLSRVVTLVTAAYFAFTYVQAYSSLHYYIPAMVLPLVVFWRNDWFGGDRRRAFLTATAAAGFVALWLSWPVTSRPYTTARAIGATIEDRVDGYSNSNPDVFRSSEVMNQLFPPDWDPQVPHKALGGSPLVWNYYAQTTGASAGNYVVQRSSDPSPAGATRAFQDAEFTVFVRDTALWMSHRTLRPPAPAGARIYQVSRAVLFHAGSGDDGFRIINVRAMIRRLRR